MDGGPLEKCWLSELGVRGLPGKVKNRQGALPDYHEKKAGTWLEGFWFSGCCSGVCLFFHIYLPIRVPFAIKYSFSVLPSLVWTDGTVRLIFNNGSLSVGERRFNSSSNLTPYESRGLKVSGIQAAEFFLPFGISYICFYIFLLSCRFIQGAHD